MAVALARDGPCLVLAAASPSVGEIVDRPRRLRVGPPGPGVLGPHRVAGIVAAGCRRHRLVSQSCHEADSLGGRLSSTELENFPGCGKSGGKTPVKSRIYVWTIGRLHTQLERQRFALD